MSDEIELISDGDGLAVIGDPASVERFLMGEGLSESKELGLPRLDRALFGAAGGLQAAAEIAAGSGRWVKLTKETAEKINKFGLMKGSSPGLSRGVVQASGGQIKAIVQFATGPAALLASPAFLAGAAAIMSQIAMEQAMDEITDYLAIIDEKVDDLLRAQKDAVVADMIGVDFLIEEAMTIRSQVGHVSETTWSKVQGTAVTIARTQAYALRQLDALAEKLEKKSAIGDVARASKEAEPKVREWLAILAGCFQLQDGIAVLELDRVLDASPGELDLHRLALKAARENRVELIERSTRRLLDRMDAAAAAANGQVLLHPSSSRSVVRSSNHVAGDVVEFRSRLGIEGGRSDVESKRWTTAVIEARDKIVDVGQDSIEAAARFGGASIDRAQSATAALAERFAERTEKWREADDEPDDSAPTGES
ncbi:hypothetical protein [Galbitalea soli]|uniref:Uncharacterized protein n=1 Tax=Galbitalea soli TaxID=1268042 RepID=A0A7C9TPQ2_9MICO|nr:hypothetical protein [Galbitalea soli]NEM90876.1 hypothetical protein [Galbitalea soli]NYJ31596.1 hypothetical protein [Galbitalea soli]